MPFRCRTLFDIHPTKAYKLSNENIFKDGGSTLVVSNSSNNNGIAGYSNLKLNQTTTHIGGSFLIKKVLYCKDFLKKHAYKKIQILIDKL